MGEGGASGVARDGGRDEKLPEAVIVEKWPLLPAARVLDGARWGVGVRSAWEGGSGDGASAASGVATMS